MRVFWRHFRRSLLRVFPRCLTQAQAVAFNLFLAFFPGLLLVLGILSATGYLTPLVEDLLARLRLLLPPGSRVMVTDFLRNAAGDSATLLGLGLGGTVLVGTQVMTGLLQGIALVHDETGRRSFWARQWRALVLLPVAIGPWLFALGLAVFSAIFREWLIERIGLPAMFRFLWEVAYVLVGIALGTLVLAVIYRLGRQAPTTLREVLPGALLATVLWWVVNRAFGFYVRRMPYHLVYGGLAAAIGLMVWMYLSVLVVFLGAAFNAERHRDQMR